MTNILFVSNSGTIIGGGEISLLQLVQHLDRSKFRPLVVCPGQGNFTTAVLDLGIEPAVITMPGLRELPFIRALRAVRQLMRLIGQQEIRVVHANGSRCMIYAGLAARLMGIPVIWHVRVMHPEALLDTLLGLLAARIVVNSRAVAGRFRSRHLSKKVSIVYNGVDTAKFHPSLDGSRIRREFSLDKQVPLVTIVGRMDAWKGHEFFLRAAHKVLAHKHSARFLLVGEGTLRDKLQHLSRKMGIEKEVIFCGYREDVPELLAASDILVSASLGEHFGRVIIEAMAVGKPVVATRAGGVPEIVLDGQTGILVQPADPEQMSRAILSLLDNAQACREMGLEGLKRVKQVFDIETHAREVEKIYSSLLGN